ncbi:YciI family protein [Patulibacter minatonensis]|uniref:YciI family protein n=1 Tax=Patulibacter minatonensis TaxID=298163 RepID=UPI00047A0AEF|nr:YciI family protein [Patulibacter minatonensis]
MRYLALIYGNAEIWSGDPERFRAMVAEVDRFNSELTASGEMAAVEGLGHGVVAIRGGGDGPVVTDGPYLEAKEHVGSYFLLDVASPERALEIASSYPALTHCDGGGLELWPLMQPGGPTE